MNQEPRELKRGLYETEYGNTCYVSGPKAKTAWDIDAGQRIPIELVGRYLRPAKGWHPGE